MKQFIEIIADFKTDILITYPEYKGRLCKELDELDEQKLKEYCTEITNKIYYEYKNVH